MKKIIICLSVVCLVTTMFTISTFAAESEDLYLLPAGEYTVGEVTVPVPDGYETDYAIEVAIPFTEVGSNSNYVSWRFRVYDHGLGVFMSNSVGQFTMQSPGSSYAQPDKVYVFSEDHYLTHDEYAFMSTLFYGQLEPLPTPEIPTECDGTVCPLSDPNLDNLCDECGLPVTFSLRSTMLDYARSEIDRALSGAVSSGQYWLIFDRTSDTNTGQKVYYSYISSEPFYENDGKLYAGSNGTALVHRQIITEEEDGTFSSSGWSSSQTGNIPVNLTLIIDSSHDKSFFFQMPLWEIVQEAGQAEMKANTLKSVGEVMLVLTIAGVSLIALLVGLILLSKKLSSFLPR